MSLTRNKKLSVKFSNEIKGNFIRIPNSTADSIYTSHIEIQKFRFKLDHKWYVSWDGFDSSDDNSIEINPILAKCLGFQPNQLISFEMEQFEPLDSMISEAYVKPLSSDDWEIAELHSNYLQQEILNQTKLINLCGVIVCYIGNTVCKFTVEKIIPENHTVGLIGDGSLIIVEPMENKIRNRNLKVSPNETTTTAKRSLCWEFFSNKNECKETCIYMNDNEIIGEYAYISVIENKIEKMHSNKMKQKQEVKEDQPIIKHTNRIITRILPANVVHDEKLPIGYTLLSTTIRNSLFVEHNSQPNNGTRLKVEFLNDATPITGPQLLDMSIILHFNGKSDIKRIERIQKSILNTNYITNMQLFKEESVVVELVDSAGIHIPCINLSGYDTHKIRIETRVNSNLAYIKEDHTSNNRGNPEIPYVELDKTLSEIISHVSKNVIASPGIVIEGTLGVGKTSLIREIENRLLQNTSRHVIFYDCESLQNTFNYEKMHTYISNQLVSLSYWYQPSIIILDNAEFLFSGTISNNETDSGNNGNTLSDRLTLLLIQQITGLVNKNNNIIRIIFTSSRKDLLNKFFYEKHFIGKTWSLKPPVKQARKLLLDHLLPISNISLNSDFTSNDMSMELEGYSVLDIKNLVERLLYGILIQQGPENERILSWKQFESINDEFIPIFLQGVEKNQNNDTNDTMKQGWNQIGGLIEAKRTLLETLEWPVKYSPIFQKSPLRLRSGLLIYGYPGCGKTLLANAISKECGGLNFLPVKGPEILNKYIGASEQNVRNLFERAQSLSPCILFFDEFDSVATKRGHDSTGVTDRIVNQLLTQMDGAEKLDGVYVVAATSRPDLIDPALLRPGRLDKAIFCDIPDNESRLDILKKLLHDNCEINEIDLIEIVKGTEGYSGADLQGLYYNAHLSAVHRQLNNMKLVPDNKDETIQSKTNIEYTILSNEINDTDKNLIEQEILEYNKIHLDKTTTNKQDDNLQPSKPVVTINDLIKCCHDTRPSISTHEYLKLSKIYQEFQGTADRPAELHNGDTERIPGTRITLA